MRRSSAQTVRKVAGWLGLAVLTTLLFGVLALWLTARANTQELADFNRILRVVDTTRLAQVHFKTQVQEWKNVLLRGQNLSDYERHLSQFHVQRAGTIDQLRQAAALKVSLGLDSSDVDAALAEHAVLMRQYEDALGGYQQGVLASVFAVDAGIRGRDRQLNEMIDRIAADMRQEADRRMQAFAEEGGRRYARLRAIFIALSVATLILAGWLAMLTLRRQGETHAA